MERLHGETMLTQNNFKSVILEGQGLRSSTSWGRVVIILVMGFITRALIPRSVRRAVHPVRAVRRAVTPRPVKRAMRALNPIDNAIYGVTRKLNTRHRSSNSQKFEHSGCNIQHRSVDALNNCRNGQGGESVQRTPQRLDQYESQQFRNDRAIRHDVQNDRKLCLSCGEYYFQDGNRTHCESL